MIKIAFCLYREWGYQIYKNILDYQTLRGDFKIAPIIACTDYQFKLPEDGIVVNPNDTNAIYKILKKEKADLVCFFSWSYIVREPILSEFICLCLHPSLVPQNRGGTPIQNQIIAGVKDSGVSLFRMVKDIDAGPVYKQTTMSLLGDIDSIFNRMVDLGTLLTKDLITDHINGNLAFVPQKGLEKYPILKRRTPDMSKIKQTDLKITNFEDLNNKVRSLLDPYPNAFIDIKEKRIYIQEIIKYPTKPSGLSLKIKDGYAKITKFRAN